MTPLALKSSYMTRYTVESLSFAWSDVNTVAEMVVKTSIMWVVSRKWWKKESAYPTL